MISKISMATSSLNTQRVVSLSAMCGVGIPDLYFLTCCQPSDNRCLHPTPKRSFALRAAVALSDIS